VLLLNINHRVGGKMKIKSINKAVMLALASAVFLTACDSDGLGNIVRPSPGIAGNNGSDGNDGNNGGDGNQAASPIDGLVDQLVGPDGLLPLTSSSGNSTLLDPVLGHNGLLPLTTGDGDGPGPLLDPVIGSNGILPRSEE